MRLLYDFLFNRSLILRKPDNITIPRTLNPDEETPNIFEWPYIPRLIIWAILTFMALTVFLVPIVILYPPVGLPEVSVVGDIRKNSHYFDNRPLTAVEAGKDAVFVLNKKSLETYNPKSYLWHTYDPSNSPIDFPFDAHDMAYYPDLKSLFFLKTDEVWSCPVDSYKADTKKIQKNLSIGNPWPDFLVKDDLSTTAVKDGELVYTAVYGVGLGIYDPTVHSWEAFPIPGEHLGIMDFCIKDRLVWLSSGKGIYVADKSSRLPAPRSYQLAAENLSRLKVINNQRAIAMTKDHGMYIFDGEWRGPFLGGPPFRGLTDSNMTAAIFVDQELLVAAAGIGIGVYDTPHRQWSHIIPCEEIPMERDVIIREFILCSDTVVGRSSGGLVFLDKTDNGWVAQRIDTDPVSDVALLEDCNGLYYITDQRSLKYYSRTSGDDPLVLISDKTIDLEPEDKMRSPLINDVIGLNDMIYLGLAKQGILRYRYKDHSLEWFKVYQDLANTGLKSIGPVEEFTTFENRIYALAGGTILEMDTDQDLWAQRTDPEINIETVSARSGYLFALDEKHSMYVFTLEGDMIRVMCDGNFSEPGRSEYVGDLISLRDQNDLGIISLLAQDNLLQRYDARQRSWNASLQLPFNKTIHRVATVWFDDDIKREKEPNVMEKNLLSQDKYFTIHPLHAFYLDDKRRIGYDDDLYLKGGKIAGSVDDLNRAVKIDDQSLLVVSQSAISKYQYSMAGFDQYPMPSDWPQAATIRSLVDWKDKIYLTSEQGGLWWTDGLDEDWYTVLLSSKGLAFGKDVILIHNQEDLFDKIASPSEAPFPLNLFRNSGEHIQNAFWADNAGERKVVFVSPSGISLYDFSLHNWDNVSLPDGTIHQIERIGDRLLVATSGGLRRFSLKSLEDMETYLDNRDVYWIGEGRTRNEFIILARNEDDFELYRFSGNPPSGTWDPDMVIVNQEGFQGNLRSIQYAMKTDQGKKFLFVDKSGFSALYEPLTGQWEETDLADAGALEVLGRLNVPDAKILLSKTSESWIRLSIWKETEKKWVSFFPDIPTMISRVNILGNQTLFLMTSDGDIWSYDITGREMNGFNLTQEIRNNPKTAATLQRRLDQFTSERERYQTLLEDEDNQILRTESDIQDHIMELSDTIESQWNSAQDKVAYGTSEKDALVIQINTLNEEVQSIDREYQDRVQNGETVKTTIFNSEADIQRKENDIVIKNEQIANTKILKDQKTQESDQITTDLNDMNQIIKPLKELPPSQQRKISAEEEYSQIKKDLIELNKKIKSHEYDIKDFPIIKKNLDQLTQQKNAIDEENRQMGSITDPTQRKIYEFSRMKYQDALKEAENRNNKLTSTKIKINADLQQLLNQISLLEGERVLLESSKTELENSLSSRTSELMEIERLTTELSNQMEEKRRSQNQKESDSEHLSQLVSLIPQLEDMIANSEEYRTQVSHYQEQYDLFNWVPYWQSSQPIDFDVVENNTQIEMGILTGGGYFQFTHQPNTGTGRFSCEGRMDYSPQSVEEIAFMGNSILVGSSGRARWLGNFNPEMDNPTSPSNWRPSQDNLPECKRELPVAAQEMVSSEMFRYDPAKVGNEFELRFDQGWIELNYDENGFFIDRAYMVVQSDDNMLVFTGDGIGIKNLSQSNQKRFDRILDKNAWPVSYDEAALLLKRREWMMLPSGQCFRFGGDRFQSVEEPPLREVFRYDPLNFVVRMGINRIVTEPSLSDSITLEGEFIFDQISAISSSQRYGHFLCPWGVWTFDMEPAFHSFTRTNDAPGQFIQLDGEDGYWQRGGEYYNYTDRLGNPWARFTPPEPEFKEVSRTGPWTWEENKQEKKVRIFFDPSIVPGRLPRTMTDGQFDDDCFLSLDTFSDKAILGTKNAIWSLTPDQDREYLGHLGKQVTNINVERGIIYADVDGNTMMNKPENENITNEWRSADPSSERESPHFSIGPIEFMMQNNQIQIASKDNSVQIWEGKTFYFDWMNDLEFFDGLIWTATTSGGMLAYQIDRHLVDARYYTTGNNLVPSNQTLALAYNNPNLFLRCNNNVDSKWNRTRWEIVNEGVKPAIRAADLGLDWVKKDLFETGVFLKIDDIEVKNWYRDGKMAFDWVIGVGISQGTRDNPLWASGLGLTEGSLKRRDAISVEQPVCYIENYEELNDIISVDVRDSKDVRFLRSHDKKTFVQRSGKWVKIQRNAFAHPRPFLAPGNVGKLWLWRTEDIDQDLPQLISCADPLIVSPLFYKSLFSFDYAVAAAVHKTGLVLTQGPFQIITNQYGVDRNQEPVINIREPLKPAPETTVDVEYKDDETPMGLSYFNPQSWKVWTFADTWKEENSEVDRFKRPIALLDPTPFSWVDYKALDPFREKKSPYIEGHPNYPWFSQVKGGARFSFDVLKKIAAIQDAVFFGTDGSVVGYTMNSDGRMIPSLLLLKSGQSDYAVKGIMDIKEDIYILFASSVLMKKQDVLVNPDLGYNPFYEFYVGGLLGGNKYVLEDDGRLYRNKRKVKASGKFGLFFPKNDVHSLLEFDPDLRGDRVWVLGKDRLYMIDGE